MLQYTFYQTGQLYLLLTVVNDMKTPHRDLGYRRPPDCKSMHSKIVSDLGIRIVSGELKPDDRLPTEVSLCAAYHVSRSVLREATRVLVAKGLVISKQRAGAIVRPKSDWHLLDPDVLYWSMRTKPLPEFVETLMTVRRIFDPAAASLAAKLASVEGIQGVADAYARMEAAKTPEEFLVSDLAFHRCIAEATGNDLLAFIGNVLSLALRESIAPSIMRPDIYPLSLPRHKAVLTALLNRDPLGAHQATFKLLEETFLFLGK